jgi:hypothetical protein
MAGTARFGWIPRPKLSPRLVVGLPFWAQSRQAVVRPKTCPDRPSPGPKPDSLAFLECLRRRALPALAGSSAGETNRRGESESVRGCCPLSRHRGRGRVVSCDPGIVLHATSGGHENRGCNSWSNRGAIAAGPGVKISPSAPAGQALDPPPPPLRPPRLRRRDRRFRDGAGSRSAVGLSPPTRGGAGAFSRLGLPFVSPFPFFSDDLVRWLPSRSSATLTVNRYS